jgi:hypothetical protein
MSLSQNEVQATEEENTSKPDSTVDESNPTAPPPVPEKDTVNQSASHNVILEEDEEQEENAVETSAVETNATKTGVVETGAVETGANGHANETEPVVETKDKAESVKRPASPARQPSRNGHASPETRTNRHERGGTETPSPGKPRRSRSVRDSFQAYYKVFKSRANRNRSPPRNEAIEEELQRLRKTIKTYEKQLEEASDTILLQDRVLTRWEKISQKVCIVPVLNINQVLIL